MCQSASDNPLRCQGILITSAVYAQCGTAFHERRGPALEKKLEGGNIVIQLDDVQHAARIGEFLVDVVGKVSLEAARVPGEDAGSVVWILDEHAAGEGEPDGTQIQRVVCEGARLYAAASAPGWDPERLEIWVVTSGVDVRLVGDEIAVSRQGRLTAVEYWGGM